MSRNKAQKFIDKVVAASFNKGDDLLTEVYWAIDKKFVGKKTPPEYKQAYIELRDKIQFFDTSRKRLAEIKLDVLF